MTESKTMLDDILNGDEVAISEFERENYTLEPLLEEIGLIQDQPIRFFVRSILLRADAFWEMPVGIDYTNPPDEYVIGGEILHTKRVVRALLVLCESYGFATVDRDILLAAAILHDLTKGIRDHDDPSIIDYDPMYPYTIDKFVKFIREDDQRHATEGQSSTLYIDDAIASDIIRLVHCHRGPFSPIPETYPQTVMENVLHIADHMASRVHYIMDGAAKEERWTQE